VLDRPASRLGARQLDQADPGEESHVVADVAQRGVDLVGDLAGARNTVLEEAQDLDAKRVGEALDKPRIVDLSDRLHADREVREAESIPDGTLRESSLNVQIRSQRSF
jgi:hypothetical protein